MESIEKIHFQFSTFEEVCPYTMDELRQKRRKRCFVYWRQVGQWWLRQEGCSLESIAAMFDLNHATVMHSIKQVKLALYGYNDEMLQMIEEVIRKAPLKEQKYGFNPTEDACVNEVISVVLMENYK